MKKKAFCFILSLVLCFSLFPVYAEESAAFDLSTLHAKYAILVDASNPTEALYGIEKDADVQCPTASTIKILSCILALENGNLDDVVTISAEAGSFSSKNSLMGVKEGEQWTLRDLLYGMMLPSGNDAAVAIAEHIAGSTNDFAKLMNAKAEELGMTSSHFITVNGKDSKSHYSTARDMAKLTAYALQNQDFRKIVGTGQYTCTDVSGKNTLTLTNTDRLIVDQVASDGSYTPQSCLYKYAIGVKTGDTNNAGKCFIGAAEKGGTTLIAVLLGGTLDDEYYTKNWYGMRDKEKDPYNAQRFEDAIAVFDYAFKEMSVLLTLQDLVDLGLPVEFNDIQVENYDSSDENGGKLNLKVDIDTSVELQLMKPYYDTLVSDISAAYTVNISSPLYAPINEGDTVGTIIYNIDGDNIAASYNLIATRTVKEGIFSTETVEADVGAGSAPSLIGLATGIDGASVTPAPVVSEKDASNTVLTVALIALAVILAAFIVFLIVVKVRREKRRKARLARKRRQQEIAARQRRKSSY